MFTFTKKTNKCHGNDLNISMTTHTHTHAHTLKALVRVHTYTFSINRSVTTGPIRISHSQPR